MPISGWFRPFETQLETLLVETPTAAGFGHSGVQSFKAWAGRPEGLDEAAAMILAQMEQAGVKLGLG